MLPLNANVCVEALKMIPFQVFWVHLVGSCLLSACCVPVLSSGNADE